MTGALCRTISVPETHIVRSNLAREYTGFLLARSGAIGHGAKFWALYNDGYTEEINPVDGDPRPTPDPAVRTQGMVIPPSMRALPSPIFETGSLFSGQMRRVVQCEHSRGEETKFQHSVNVTHGLLEYPAKHVGRDAGEEQTIAALRTYYIVEISNAGIFTAPVRLLSTCLGSVDMEAYIPTNEQVRLDPSLAGHRSRISLAWAITAAPSKDKVQQIATAAQMNDIALLGAPLYADHGWAFSYTGTKVSQVFFSSEGDGIDFSIFGPSYYKTTLVDIAISVVPKSGSHIAINIVSTGVDSAVARLFMVGHGLSNGSLVSVFGCNEDEFNGAHLIFNAHPTYFDFYVEKTAPSTATGDPQVADADAPVNISAIITKNPSGKVPLGGGTIWLPSGLSSSEWEGIDVFRNNPPLDGGGPVFVFYRGEEKEVVTWSLASTSNPTFTFAQTWANGPFTPVDVCQQPDGATAEGDIIQMPILIDIGHFNTGVAGFAAAGSFNHAVTSISEHAVHTQVTSQSAQYETHTTYGNFYGLKPSCQFTDEHGTLITACSNAFNVTQTIGVFVTQENQTTNSAGGASFFVLVPNDREAYLALYGFSTTESGFSQLRLEGSCGIHYSEDPVYDTCPAGHYEHGERHGLSAEPSQAGLQRPPAAYSNNTVGGGWFLRAGSYTKSGSFAFDSSNNIVGSNDLVDFLIFGKTKTIASSSLFVMRGGLYYTDPTLTPPDQSGNILSDVNGVVSLQGGFGSLVGKSAIAFIGVV